MSFLLEWNGLKLSYSSDTFPNKWWMDHAKGSAIATHECFASPKILIDKQKFGPATALNVGAQVDTSAAQFGKVMAETNPRMAAVNEGIWPQPSTIPLVPPDPKLQRTALSELMVGVRVVHRDPLEKICTVVNEQFGSNAKVPE